MSTLIDLGASVKKTLQHQNHPVHILAYFEAYIKNILGTFTDFLGPPPKCFPTLDKKFLRAPMYVLFVKLLQLLSWSY